MNELSAEQIQSAIERAQNRIVILADHADCPQDGFDIDCTFRLELECAQALLDVYGRLQEAETREVILRGTLSTADIEISNYCAELTEARRQLEMMREAFEELQQITPTETQS